MTMAADTASDSIRLATGPASRGGPRVAGPLRCTQQQHRSRREIGPPLRRLGGGIARSHVAAASEDAIGLLQRRRGSTQGPPQWKGACPGRRLSGVASRNVQDEVGSLGERTAGRYPPPFGTVEAQFRRATPMESKTTSELGANRAGEICAAWARDPRLFGGCTRRDPPAMRKRPRCCTHR